MQLPQSQARQKYIEQIKVVEANLKDATTDEKNKVLLAQVQKRLDSLAEKYQFSEEIGMARYKLYELQALVHYFDGHDDDALDFINQAIEMVEAFLTTEFEGGRHQNRVDKIACK